MLLRQIGLIFFSFLVLTGSFVALDGQASESTEYIKYYKDIAVSEMHRTGVPASIKLAQALLESRWGQSDLAIYANNHFGIKCGGSWDGEVFYRFDDDVDKNGQPIKSCFRKFDSAFESFIAHSDFLTDNPRYSDLFNFNITDYKSWARGLKKAGYATDKHYPLKLIELIERYELYQFDVSDPGILASADIEKTNNRTRRDSEFDGPSTDIASVDNEAGSSSRSRRLRNRNFHIVVPGETVARIAAIHNVKPSTILLRNRIPRDAEPLPGELLYIRGTIRLNHQVKYSRNKSALIASSDSDFIF